MPLQLTNVSNTNPLKPAVAAPQKNIGSKDVFLKLLVAQMKNQNPEKPQDPTKMSSQLAQFNMVEQQMSTNKLLKDMAALQGSNQSSGATGLTAASGSYLGHNVTVNQSTIPFNGIPISFSTNLAMDAASTQVLVRDASGQVVRTINAGAMAKGIQNFSWDGLNDSGTKMAAGNYSFEISALDYQGQNIQANVQRSGLVDAVRMAQSGVQLMVGGSAVDVASVTEVRL